MGAPFRVALSADFRSDRLETSWGDIGLGKLGQAGIAYDVLDVEHAVLSADQIDGYDAVIFAAPAVDAATVAGPHPPALLARFGVGLDSVDLTACTAAGVAVTITPDGAKRPVATAALAMILAAGHRLIAKDRLVRTARWESKLDLLGSGLTGKTVGTMGFGNIAHELFTLLAPFATRNLTADPFRDPETTARHGVELVDLPTLMQESDVVVVTAALTPETFHAIGAAELALMKSTAIIVNIARGPIIDVEALTEVLRHRSIAGAGLDVFEVEPVPADHPLLALDNVVLSPHALAWTDEMAAGNGGSAVNAVLDVFHGRRPTFLGNPAVMSIPAFVDRLARSSGRLPVPATSI